MAYTKQTWSTGDTITADKLNHIEDGIDAAGIAPAPASSGTPAMDGTAARGSSAQYARADHVHPTDTSRAAASDLANKITAPSSPATGAFLVYNGSAWVAQTLSTWQGGSY